MKYIFTTLDSLSESDINKVSQLAAAGFGQPHSTSMIEDTTEHLQAAETIQLAFEDTRVTALALYKSCLWQHSH